MKNAQNPKSKYFSHRNYFFECVLIKMHVMCPAILTDDIYRDTVQYSNKMKTLLCEHFGKMCRILDLCGKAFFETVV